jgi:lipopolysaccharide/colanic/teichoic acid biosynthesis glycosyltransferase
MSVNLNAGIKLLRGGNPMMNFVSEMERMDAVSISYHDLEGTLGMEAARDLPPLANESLKRIMDILITLLLVLLFLPLLLLTALLVRLDSPGPILYTQPRLGKDGRKILIYKFRSMRVDSDHLLVEYLRTHLPARLEWEQTQKLRSDPRITRVGKWIREFSIDELPQLFNILKGDMSLVGPRPILPEQVKLYGAGIDLYRHVRPGLTTFLQRTLYDVYYVRNWSVWLDALILLRTVWVVLSRDGAY